MDFPIPHEEAVLFTFDPTRTWNLQEVVRLDVYAEGIEQPFPLAMNAILTTAASDDGGQIVGARLWLADRDQYLGTISWRTRIDSTNTEAKVVGFQTTIDRMTTHHALFTTALKYVGEHAALILPGLQALDFAILRAPRDERAHLRAAIDGLTSRVPNTRYRWAKHAQALSTRSRLYPEPEARTA